MKKYHGAYRIEKLCAMKEEVKLQVNGAGFYVTQTAEDLIDFSEAFVNIKCPTCRTSMDLEIPFQIYDEHEITWRCPKCYRVVTLTATDRNKVFFRCE